MATATCSAKKSASSKATKATKATKTSKATEKAAPAEKKPSRSKKGAVKCGCGCGQMTKPGSKFLQGHDARFHGRCRKLADGRMTMDDLIKELGKTGEYAIPAYKEGQKHFPSEPKVKITKKTASAGKATKKASPKVRKWKAGDSVLVKDEAGDWSGEIEEVYNNGEEMIARVEAGPDTEDSGKVFEVPFENLRPAA